MAGRVRGHSKAGEQVADDALLELVPSAAYVSRAGGKLAGALDPVRHRPGRARLPRPLAPRPAGSPTSCSSGGRPASSRSDVGHGQLHPRLRADPRVVVLRRGRQRAHAHRAAVRPVASDVRRLVHLRPSRPPARACPLPPRLGGARPRQAAVRGAPRRGAQGGHPRPAVQRARRARGSRPPRPGRGAHGRRRRLRGPGRQGEP